MPTPQSTRRASASATIACTIIMAREEESCPCTGRWRNRSTLRRSACRSRSAKSTGLRSRAITSPRSPRSGGPRSSRPRAMGVTTPLVDTVSLPVGADEVKMIDMVAANATLASGGVRVSPCAAIEVRNSNGELIYSHERDSGPPVRVLPADKVAEMNNIMTHVVTEGTGRAAQIPGLAISGKTGTTNNSTNAWFNAFTGNLVGSVWFGNDDNAPMENMTGGTLPAMSWHDIMVFAHQGLDPKPPFGEPAPPPASAAAVADAAKAAPAGASPQRIGLSPSATKAIRDIGDLAQEALKNGPTTSPEAGGSTGGANVVRGAMAEP